MAKYTFSNGNLVWNGKDFLNQQKGKYVARKPFGHVYARHADWMRVNNPLNFKVDRSKPASKKEGEKSEIEKLQEELAKTRMERDQLKSKRENSKKKQNM